jgi:hypothetical protein
LLRLLNEYIVSDQFMQLTNTTASKEPRGERGPDVHQQPDVNYIQVLEKVDFPCTVHAQRLPFEGNRLRAETG